MTMRATDGYRALTEKEKQTLRLIVRGHDAKSIARSLDLSVHTVNERLRDARRKMAVSSSREAARRLFDTEGNDLNISGSNSLGDVKIGEATASNGVEQGAAPTNGAQRSHRFAWITIGVAPMTLALGFFALMALPQLISTPPQSPPAATEAADPAIVEAARQFLVLGDQGRWDESYRATSTPFRKLNTRQVWASVSQKVRPPLGAVLSRVLISQEDCPLRRTAMRWSSFAPASPTRPTPWRPLPSILKTVTGALRA
jgi:DNA-binding CsgD family transcriptional regulator